MGFTFFYLLLIVTRDTCASPCGLWLCQTRRWPSGPGQASQWPPGSRRGWAQCSQRAGPEHRAPSAPASGPRSIRAAPRRGLIQRHRD